MSKAEEFYKTYKPKINTLETKDHKAFIDAIICDVAEAYHQSRIKDISVDLELRKSCMDIDTYQSYKRRDSFHKGWTALKNKLLKQ